MRPLRWVLDNPALVREWSARHGSGRRRALRLEIARWSGLLLLLCVYGASVHWLAAPERTPWEAQSFLFFVCLIYLIAVFALVPGPAAAAISLERERETWQQLLLTSLRPEQIVAAKFLPLLWPALELLGLALPLLVAATHAARLPLDQAAPLLLVLVAAPFGLAAFALWLSARCRRTLVAVGVAYFSATLLFWGTLAAVPSFYLRGENLWWYVSPVWQIAFLCLNAPTPSPLVFPLLPEWGWFVLFYAGAALLCLRLLARRVAAVEVR